MSVRDSKDDEGNPDTTTDNTIAVTILVTEVTEVTEVNEAPVFPSATATRTILGEHARGREHRRTGGGHGRRTAATLLTYSLGGTDAGLLLH